MRQRLTLTTTSLHNVVISNSSDVIYYEIVTPKWERRLTKISRLDPNTRQFDFVGELQNKDDKPVAVRLYGGSSRSTKEFLKDVPLDSKAWLSFFPGRQLYGRHSKGRDNDDLEKQLPTERAEREPGPVTAENRGHGQTAESDIAGPSSAQLVNVPGNGTFRTMEESGGQQHRPNKYRWCEAASFKGKDGRQYTWRGDQKHLELLREDMPERPVATYHRQKRHFYVLRMSQHPYLEVDAAVMDTLDFVILSFLLIERRRRDGKK